MSTEKGQFETPIFHFFLLHQPEIPQQLLSKLTFWWGIDCFDVTRLIEDAEMNYYWGLIWYCAKS